MKNIYIYLIATLIGICSIIGISIYNTTPVTYKYEADNQIYNSHNEIVTKEEPTETKEVKVEAKEVSSTKISETKTTTEANADTKVTTNVEQPQKEETTTEKVYETFTGSMSGYGYDCYGCTSGHTSSGYDISPTGSIYYNDTTYGSVRIVAGDTKYSFGTIVKISDYKKEESFYAIVLDRGSDIGVTSNKKFAFDLVYPSNKDADGVDRSVTFEIVRYGY